MNLGKITFNELFKELIGYYAEKLHVYLENIRRVNTDAQKEKVILITVIRNLLNKEEPIIISSHRICYG